MPSFFLHCKESGGAYTFYLMLSIPRGKLTLAKWLANHQIMNLGLCWVGIRPEEFSSDLLIFI